MTISKSRLLALCEDAFVIGALFLLAKAGLAFFAGPDATIDQEEGSRGFQLLAALTYAVSGILVSVRHRKVIAVGRDNLPVILLVIIIVASTGWSVNSAVTLRRSIALLGTTLFALYLVVRYQPYELIRIVALALGIMAVASMLAVIVTPDLAIHQDRHVGAWRGVFSHKNAFGRFMTLGVLANALLATKQSRFRVLYITTALLCLGLVGMSQSRTAWVVTLALGVAFLIFRAFQARLVFAIPLIGFIIALSSAIVIVIASNLQDILFLLGRDMSLTGRVPLWTASLQDIMSRPWLGHGYRAYWLGERSASVDALFAAGWIQSPSHGHNAFLDLCLEIGLIGFGVFVVIVVMCSYRSLTYLRHSRAAIATWPPLLLTYLFVFALPGGELVSQNSIAWVLMVALSAHSKVLIENPFRRRSKPLQHGPIGYPAQPLPAEQ